MEEAVKCELCEMIFPGESSRNLHLALKHGQRVNTNTRTVKCRYCMKSYRSRSDLKKHMKKVHEDVEGAVMPEKRNRVFCAVCFGKFGCYHIEELIEHYNKKHGFKGKVKAFAFKSIEKFKMWKWRMEHGKCSHFVVTYCKVKNSSKDGPTLRYLHCSQSFRVVQAKLRRYGKHISFSTNGGNLPGQCCPSFIAATFHTDGTVSATACLQHYNHINGCGSKRSWVKVAGECPACKFRNKHKSSYKKKDIYGEKRKFARKLQKENFDMGQFASRFKARCFPMKKRTREEMQKAAEERKRHSPPVEKNPRGQQLRHTFDLALDDFMRDVRISGTVDECRNIICGMDDEDFERSIDDIVSDIHTIELFNNEAENARRMKPFRPIPARRHEESSTESSSTYSSLMYPVVSANSVLNVDDEIATYVGTPLFVSNICKLLIPSTDSDVNAIELLPESERIVKQADIEQVTVAKASDMRVVFVSEAMEVDQKTDTHKWSAVDVEDLDDIFVLYDSNYFCGV